MRCTALVGALALLISSAAAQDLSPADAIAIAKADEAKRIALINKISKAFVANIEYLRLRSDVDAMMYRFRLRKDAACHSEKPVVS